MAAKTGRVTAARRFAREMRSWRGPIARKQLAEMAGVQLFILGVIEHGKVHQVRVEDVLKVVDMLSIMRQIERQREDLIRQLLRVVVGSRNKPNRCCCHGRQRSIRR